MSAVQCCPLVADRSFRAVRGLYSYKAQGPDEIDVEEGKLIRLTEGPNGGRNYADGWWEG